MTSTAENARSALERLLLRLFDHDGLLRHLRVGRDGEIVRSELPDRVSLRELVHAAVDVLLRRGLVDAAFFDRLQAEFPARSEDIMNVRCEWSNAPGPAGPAVVAGDSPETSRRSVAWPGLATAVAVAGLVYHLTQQPVPAIATLTAGILVVFVARPGRSSGGSSLEVMGIHAGRDARLHGSATRVVLAEVSAARDVSIKMRR